MLDHSSFSFTWLSECEDTIKLWRELKIDGMIHVPARLQGPSRVQIWHPLDTNRNNVTWACLVTDEDALGYSPNSIPYMLATISSCITY